MARTRGTIKPYSLAERFREIDRFFAGTSKVHRSMRLLTRRLERACIPYAVYGGMAVNAHGHRQTTDDVDVLLLPEDLMRFRAEFARFYGTTRLRSGKRFLDLNNGVPIDVVVSGQCPGIRGPAEIRYPKPIEASEIIGGIRYVDLRWLILLKLGTARYRDLGDVAALIGVHRLTESYLENLPPSLHSRFIDCLEENRREAQIEERED